jgi:hypothetical protein
VLDKRKMELVAPFYLKMMRLNPTTMTDGELFRAIAEVGRLATADEVISLVRSAWRERVMGGWYSLAHQDDHVAAAVLRAIETSHGSLDFPPLATAAVVLVGSDQRPTATAIATYLTNDIAGEWGAAGFAAAALETLGYPTALHSANENDRSDLARMLDLAYRLRTLML